MRKNNNENLDLLPQAITQFTTQAAFVINNNIDPGIYLLCSMQYINLYIFYRSGPAEALFFLYHQTERGRIISEIFKKIMIDLSQSHRYTQTSMDETFSELSEENFKSITGLPEDDEANMTSAMELNDNLVAASAADRSLTRRNRLLSCAARTTAQEAFEKLLCELLLHDKTQDYVSLECIRELIPMALDRRKPVGTEPLPTIAEQKSYRTVLLHQKHGITILLHLSNLGGDNIITWSTSNPRGTTFAEALAQHINWYLYAPHNKLNVMCQHDFFMGESGGNIAGKILAGSMKHSLTDWPFPLQTNITPLPLEKPIPPSKRMNVPLAPPQLYWRLKHAIGDNDTLIHVVSILGLNSYRVDLPILKIICCYLPLLNQEYHSYQRIEHYIAGEYPITPETNTKHYLGSCLMRAEKAVGKDDCSRIYQAHACSSRDLSPQTMKYWIAILVLDSNNDKMRQKLGQRNPPMTKTMLDELFTGRTRRQPNLIAAFLNIFRRKKAAASGVETIETLFHSILRQYFTLLGHCRSIGQDDLGRQLSPKVFCTHEIAQHFFSQSTPHSEQQRAAVLPA